MMLFHTLHKLKFKLEQEKTSKLQKELLETAKKHNLESLKHSDEAIDRRRNFSKWIKSLRTMLLCFPKYSNIISANHNIKEMPKEKSSENYSLFILVNAFVQGYWKNVISRDNINGRGDRALAILHKMCLAMTPQLKHEYNNKFTSIVMEPNKPVSFFLRKFSISKQHAEDAGFYYSNSELVDMILNAIYKSNVPKYKTQAQIFQNQRAEGKKLHFATVEQVFNNMDLTLDRTTSSRHHANISSHTSVDTPSNKINRGPRNGKPNNRFRSRFRTPTCFACGNPDHRVNECTDKAKKDAWIAKRQEKAKNQKASPAKTKSASPKTTEYVSMARVQVHPRKIQTILRRRTCHFTQRTQGICHSHKR